MVTFTNADFELYNHLSMAEKNDLNPQINKIDTPKPSMNRRQFLEMVRNFGAGTGAALLLAGCEPSTSVSVAPEFSGRPEPGETARQITRVFDKAEVQRYITADKMTRLTLEGIPDGSRAIGATVKFTDSRTEEPVTINCDLRTYGLSTCFANAGDVVAFLASWRPVEVTVQY